MKIYPSRKVLKPLVVVLALLATSVAVYAAVTGGKIDGERYGITAGGSVAVKGPLSVDWTRTECKIASNDSGNNYFIPTKTPAEWSAFKSAATSRLIVSFSECSGSQEFTAVGGIVSFWGNTVYFGGDNFIVPRGVTSVTVSIVGGGGGGGGGNGFGYGHGYGAAGGGGGGAVHDKVVAGLSEGQKIFVAAGGGGSAGGGGGNNAYGTAGGAGGASFFGSYVTAGGGGGGERAGWGYWGTSGTGEGAYPEWRNAGGGELADIPPKGGTGGTGGTAGGSGGLSYQSDTYWYTYGSSGAGGDSYKSLGGLGLSAEVDERGYPSANDFGVAGVGYGAGGSGGASRHFGGGGGGSGNQGYVRVSWNVVP